MNLLHNSTPSYKIVVAVDLGTKYSGFAFKIKGDDKVIVNTQWEGVSGYSYKTPTCLLLDENQERIAFGAKAQEEYLKLDAIRQSGMLYFNAFKMKLYTSNNDEVYIERDLTITAANRTEVAALTVFQHSLASLKNQMIFEVEKSTGLTLGSSEILWVVTVPTTWSDQAKQFMREAAYAAGMGSIGDPRRLIIALEPEAAALFCKKLPEDNFNQAPPGANVVAQSVAATNCGIVDKGFLGQGQRYMVVDAGGGTVDVTVHEIIEDNRVKEVSRASGDSWGGEQVDKRFRNLLNDIFGKGYIDIIEVEKPAVLHELMTAFENAKRGTDFFSHKKFNILISGFKEAYKNTSDSTVEAAVTSFCEREGGQVVSFGGGALKLTLDFAKKLFLPVIADITSHVTDKVENLAGDAISVLFLVGGFARCRLLFNSLKEALPGVRVLVPPDPGTAVLKGAVEFGLCPEAVAARISRLTYGTPVLVPFNPDVHPESQKCRYGSGRTAKEYCRNVFHRFVSVGEEIRVGSVVEYPLSSLNFQQFKAEIYSSSLKEPEYVNEDDCVYEAEVIVDIEDSDSQSVCLLQMHFGSTEITVKAVDEATEKTSLARIDFLTPK